MLGPIHLTGDDASDFTSTFGGYFYAYKSAFSFTCKFKLLALQASKLAYIKNIMRNGSSECGYTIGVNSDYHPYITMRNYTYSSPTRTATFDTITFSANTEYTITLTQTNDSTSSYSFTCVVGSTSQTVTISREQFCWNTTATGGDKTDAAFGDSNVDLLSLTLVGRHYSAGSSTFTFTESNFTSQVINKATTGGTTATYSWTVDNYPSVKYYNGHWSKCQVYYYNGSAWKPCMIYYYDGTDWKYLVNN